MQTDGSPLAGTSRRLIYTGVATLLVLLTLSFRGDAQSHSDNGPHAAGLQRGIRQRRRTPTAASKRGLSSCAAWLSFEALLGRSSIL